MPTSRSSAYSSGTASACSRRSRSLSPGGQACAADKLCAPSHGSAERRPITVMFCDLVGSTSLAAKLDAEDWRNLVNAYLDEASTAVTDFGGHVLKKLGDGLMALFGYPQAQENDAERAVRAALAIQRALAELNARNAAKGAPELSARIGLDSGPVVVDADRRGVRRRAEHRGARAGRCRAWVGPHHSERAAAGGRAFRRRGAGRARTQGRVGSRSALSASFAPAAAAEGAAARALTPLVGREEELALLARRW